MKNKEKISSTTIVLIFMAVFVIIFTAVMIWLFYTFQTIPDTLVVAVFGATFGECGFCTLIYKIKKGVFKDELHGSDISPEVEAVCDTRYEGFEDPCISDSGSGIHRV